MSKTRFRVYLDAENLFYPFRDTLTTPVHRDILRCARLLMPKHVVYEDWYHLGPEYFDRLVGWLARYFDVAEGTAYGKRSVLGNRLLERVESAPCWRYVRVGAGKNKADDRLLKDLLWRVGVAPSAGYVVGSSDQQDILDTVVEPARTTYIAVITGPVEVPDRLFTPGEKYASYAGHKRLRDIYAEQTNWEKQRANRAAKQAVRSQRVAREFIAVILAEAPGEQGAPAGDPLDPGAIRSRIMAAPEFGTLHDITNRLLEALPTPDTDGLTDVVVKALSDRSIELQVAAAQPERHFYRD